MPNSEDIIKRGPKKEKPKRKLKNFGLKKVPLERIIEEKDKEIKTLKYEIGALKSERDEWEFMYKKLKADFKEKLDISTKEKERKLTLEIRREEYCKDLRNQITHLEKKLGEYKKNNEKLLMQIVKLNQLYSGNQPKIILKKN